jgi:hypothetical protein
MLAEFYELLYHLEFILLGMLEIVSALFSTG